MDTFLHGCSDQDASFAVMPKNPTQLIEALSYMREAVHNYTVTHPAKAKQVAFEDVPILTA